MMGIKRTAVLTLLVLLPCSAMFTGCATLHTVSLTGVCYDKYGVPRPDVVIKPMEVTGNGGLFSPKLPKVTERASTKTNKRGEFSVSFETAHAWLLDVQFAPGGPGSSARITPSKDVGTARKAAVKLTIDEGVLESVWEKR